ncbi:hypothetical protein I4U23_006488 [Adineta vaga]|nr:hypothetical protein I4U23_006488 [Adineta vaga]
MLNTFENLSSKKIDPQFQSAHYQNFQHALYTLKVAIEDLWRLELQQLNQHNSNTIDPSNAKLDLQVPSIYPCRTILPIANDKPIVASKSIANTKSQSISSQQKFKKTSSSISHKRRQYASGDNLMKHRRKNALLHIKFRCTKHTHINRIISNY